MKSKVKPGACSRRPGDAKYAGAARWQDFITVQEWIALYHTLAAFKAQGVNRMKK